MQTTNHLISTDVSHLRNESTKGRIIDLMVILHFIKCWDTSGYLLLLSIT